MHKLHFKDTQQERSACKSQKRARKERDRKRKRNSLDHDDELKHRTSSKRPQASASGDIPPRKWASSDEDDAGSSYGPHPVNSSKIPSDWKDNSHKPDYDTIYAELEEQRFREKMFDALGDDERLDSIEARFNDFGHVPDRWRSAGGLKAGEGIRDEDDFSRLDPQNMDEEEYAEWVRTGMYRYFFCYIISQQFSNYYTPLGKPTQPNVLNICVKRRRRQHDVRRRKHGGRKQRDLRRL